MGACFGSDSLPPVPKVIRPDPDDNPQEVVIKMLGTFFSRDFGVWDKEYPNNSGDRREKMWLWLNKGSQGSAATIDLENFVRGTKEDKNKGRVIYTAEFQETPHFEKAQRIPGSNLMNFVGIFTNDVQYNDDQYYLNHHSHRGKIGASHHRDGDMITKFQLHTHALIRDGDLGRGEGYFGKDACILEVFSTGTAATTWSHSTRQVEDRDQDGKVIGHHTVTDYHKDETEFVDRVEFRLSFRGQLMGTWFILGDSHSYNGSDPTISCPLFSVTQEGGFFTPSLTRIKTNAGYDSAFSILIAHICCSEFSVASIKSKFNPGTPDRAPGAGFGYQGFSNRTYNSGFIQPGASNYAWSNQR